MYAAGKDSARPAESDDGNSNKYKKPKYFVQTSRNTTSTIFPSVMISMGFVPFATAWIAMWGKQLIENSTGFDRAIASHGFLKIFHLKRKLVSSRK